MRQRQTLICIATHYHSRKCLGETFKKFRLEIMFVKGLQGIIFHCKTVEVISGSRHMSSLLYIQYPVVV